jgi:hypothetical protein
VTVLVVAISDKGGTGRSVTGANVAYRRAVQGGDVAYLDFDFGSPTAGTIFAIDGFERGAPGRTGLHSYLAGRVDEPCRVDVWKESDRDSLRDRPTRAGDLVLYPGDEGGGEFAATDAAVAQCVRLFLRAEERFEVSLLDLSAGRSHAVELVLRATAKPELRNVATRWLVFHRWTRQHIVAASGLVYGIDGILDHGRRLGHDAAELERSIRFVRTAVVDPNSDLAGLRAEQGAWLQATHKDLQQLASTNKVGRSRVLGEVPLDPVLQWREQLISDWDTNIRQIANRATVVAFEALAAKLDDPTAWSHS